MYWWTLRQLKADDWRAREGAVKKLGETRDARAIDSLIAALEDKNSHVRTAAQAALVQIGVPVVRPLITALKKHPELRASAKETLIQIGAPGVPTLGMALYEKDLTVRETAAAVLGKIGDAGALEQLLAALKHGDFGVKEAAAAGLVRLGKLAVNPLVSVLKEHKPRVRDTAAAALVRIGHPAIEPLIGALQEADVREAALDALTKIDPHWTKSKAAKSALPTFIAGLSQGNEQTRRAAAVVLGEIANAEAVAPLIAAVPDESEAVRESAITALGAIGDPRALLPLAAALSRNDSRSRAAAAGALVRIGKILVEPLVDALKHSEPSAREAAAAVLVRVAHSAIEPLVDALLQIDPNFAKTEPGPQPESRFIAAAKSEHPHLARGTAEKKTGEHRVIKPISISKRKDPPAISPLPITNGANPIPVSIPADLDAITSALEHADPQVRANAIRNLLQLATSPDQPVVMALKSQNVTARRAAAHALAASGDLRAREALRIDLGDSADLVVLDAAESLMRLGDLNVVSGLIQVLRRLYNSSPGSDAARIHKAERAHQLFFWLLGGYAKDLPLEDLQAISDFPSKVKPRFISSADAAMGDSGDALDENPNVLPGSHGAVDCTQIRELARRELMRRKLKS